jgi:branched-chain amino acid transport system substrate-binding protein
MTKIRIALVALFASLAAFPASSREIKVGILTVSSGPFASFGAEFKRGIELFMEERGNKIGNDTVTVIYRDTGAKPDAAKRLGEELILQDRVDVIGGIGFTPEALAIAPVLTEAKIPGVVFNAGTHFVTRKSPMLVRTSFTLDQSMVPMVDWASKEGDVKTAVICVTDYAPGQAAAATYEQELKGKGIKIVDIIKMPFDTKDFSVFVQKIKDAKPDGVFLFLPNGPPSIAFMKTVGERGLMKDGIKVFGIAEFTDTDLPKFDDNIVGAYSAWFYSPAHESAKNKAFTAAMARKFPGIVPDHMAVAAYDGMNVIYEMIAKTGGKMGPEAIDAVKGMAWESPRGPMSIDPKERDVVQNIYLRRVVKKDGVKLNEEFKTYPNVKDPWKERNPE